MAENGSDECHAAHRAAKGLLGLVTPVLAPSSRAEASHNGAFAKPPTALTLDLAAIFRSSSGYLWKQGIRKELL